MIGLSKNIRSLIPRLLPPVALNFLLRHRGPVRFTGHYSTWIEAQKASSGYDSDLILTKVRDALLKVKNGEAVYERDSVLFDKIEYSWPLLAGLLWIASLNNNKLSLIDFGGSLGSSFYQNRGFLSHLESLAWNIVEQPKFVDCGRHYFENDHLKFYGSIPECLVTSRPDTILCLSVLQYMERPYEVLKSFMSWPAGTDMGAQCFSCRPAVHDCRLVVTAQTKMLVQDGSKVRWEYGFTVTNEGWTETYFEVEGGGFV